MRDDADERQSQDYWTHNDQLRVSELGGRALVKSGCVPR